MRIGALQSAEVAAPVANPTLVMKKPSSGGSAFCGCAAKYPASTSAPAMPVIAGPLLLICLDPLCLCVHEKPPNRPRRDHLASAVSGFCYVA
jgi:hypothetical protein